MARKTTYSQSGLVKTTNFDAPDAKVETEAGDASVTDLVAQMQSQQT